MATFQTLQEHEMAFITGGGGVASKAKDLAGDINKGLGRKGKPFFGRDLVEHGAGIGVGLVAGPAAGAAALAGVKAGYDAKRGTGRLGNFVKR